ncbi:Gfo/Idh/MocA family oxidoreductase [Blastopirellula sp. J2-11]|uniref:Gfo/Idh/MocA family protein n=1 Tax=Blastopirellula sp. J2-11 TaxID=2943192 RepID=UPI0021C65670|nr:Gfo/Idh/MocA family oxidoreductase [Blastopirellula sp. J2-11]UUO04501.1 Gfo/Idh/MocA family oxidoreductase [Blastopirellula sp. J2-11]
MAMLTRRNFLKSSSLSGAALVCGISHAAPANSKLNVAAVGVGGKGWSDLNSVSASPYVNIVALCDIDEGPNNLGRAAEKFPRAKRYVDWRKMMEQSDIDAVIVATPDHMHAPISLAAMALDKHVYCEKPLAHSVAEARAMKEAAAKMGVVTQMGNQIQSHEFYRTAVRLLQDGAVGKIREVYSWQSGGTSWNLWDDRVPGSDPVPPKVHWDLWLGVAPERPYVSKCYHSYNWRNWQDFGTGKLGDFACHILDPVFTALELTAPTSLVAENPVLNKEVWPKTNIVKYIFPGTQYTADPTINVTWYSGVDHRPTREQLTLPEGVKIPKAGSVFIGEKGHLILPHVGAPMLSPQEAFEEYPVAEVEGRDHYTAWADACRGEAETSSSFSYSGPLTEAVLLGIVASRLPTQSLDWDSSKMKITNAPEANQFLRKDYRAGWTVPGV